MSKTLTTGLTPVRSKRARAEVVAINLEVPAKVFRRASDLCAGHTVLSLGRVLERWVEDAAYGATRLDSWEYEQTSAWLAGHPFPAATRPCKRHRQRRQEERGV